MTEYIRLLYTLYSNTAQWSKIARPTIGGPVKSLSPALTHLYQLFLIVVL